MFVVTVYHFSKDVLRVKYDRVLLTGFMGSGKSTVGRALAARMGCVFADTDAMIEQAEGTSIAELFRTRGEVYFRTLEHRLTYELSKREKLVTSSGGGFILTNAVYQLAASNFTIVYIDTPFEVCYARIRQDKNRPLAAGKSEQELRELYDARAKIYQIRCDFSVDASKPMCSDVVEDIIAGLR